MVQGADRPGQPNIGQRSIFGNGGPTFAQMPAYTPVTRAPGPQEPAPQPAHNPYTQPAQPAAQPAPASSQPAPQPAAPQAAAPQAPSAPAYQAPPQQPQGFGGNQNYQPQGYPAPNQTSGAPNQGYSDQDLPDLSNADPGFPESIFGDFNAASTADASFADHSAADQSHGDASFPEPDEASFPETTYAAGADFGHDELLGGGDPAGHRAMPTGGEPRYAPMNETPAQNYATAPHGQGGQQPQMPQPYQAYQPQAPQPQAAPPQAPQRQAPQSDPGRQLQAFDAVYDQPPQVSLGGQQAPSLAPQPQEYLETDRSDADFLDESQVLPPPAGRSKLVSLKGRSAFMVGSALLGAIALGGALAFAYKQSGGGMGSEQPPIVQADARPVKEVPDQPGGKEFPHKNKLIYDRLTNGNEPESERLVPRQEDVAVPALPPATETAGLPSPVATTDLTNPATTQAVAGAEEGDGGPRKVKTLRVLPDGSVEAPPAVEAAAAAPADAAAAATAAATGAAAATADAATATAASAEAAVDAATAAPAAAAAAAQQAGVMPVPAPGAPVPQAAEPAPQQVAAAAPKPAPAAPSKYVVQVGAHKSQTDALANYADIQQKNPSLLGDYPPIVQKAAVSGGTMYRLRVGPIASKSEAYKLCGDLKAQGTDCFVATQ
jgi:cell division septation protein DedD